MRYLIIFILFASGCVVPNEDFAECTVPEGRYDLDFVREQTSCSEEWTSWFEGHMTTLGIEVQPELGCGAIERILNDRDRDECKVEFDVVLLTDSDGIYDGYAAVVRECEVEACEVELEVLAYRTDP